MKTQPNEHDVKALEHTKTYADMTPIALRLLKDLAKAGHKIHQVCGPISTGGKWDVGENLATFNKAIVCLDSLQIYLFDQMPFEVPIQRIKGLRERVLQKNYDDTLLSDFYLPIFQSKLVQCMVFLPGWQHSTGSVWEHKQAEALNIEICYFVPDWETLYNKGERNVYKLIKAART